MKIYSPKAKEYMPCQFPSSSSAQVGVAQRRLLLFAFIFRRRNERQEMRTREVNGRVVFVKRNLTEYA